MGSQTLNLEIFKVIQCLVKDSGPSVKIFSVKYYICQNFLYTVLATDVYITSSSEQVYINQYKHIHTGGLYHE